MGYTLPTHQVPCFQAMSRWTRGRLEADPLEIWRQKHAMYPISVCVCVECLVGGFNHVLTILKNDGVRQLG